MPSERRELEFLPLVGRLPVLTPEDKHERLRNVQQDRHRHQLPDVVALSFVQPWGELRGHDGRQERVKSEEHECKGKGKGVRVAPLLELP